MKIHPKHTGILVTVTIPLENLKFRKFQRHSHLGDMNGWGDFSPATEGKSDKEFRIRAICTWMPMILLVSSFE